MAQAYRRLRRTVFVFDLDGTLVEASTSTCSPGRRRFDAELVARLQQAHAEAYRRRAGQARSGSGDPEEA